MSVPNTWGTEMELKFELEDINLSVLQLHRYVLQAHLLKSDKYAVSLVLNKIQGTILKKELAILYGKLQVFRLSHSR